MNKPPFAITEKMLNLVAEITEKITILEYNSQIEKKLYLRKSSKIKSVNSSCAIEANSLTEEEVTSIIDGKKVVAPKREITEITNAYKAYQNIANFDAYSIKSFLNAHQILTKNLAIPSGRFRENDVGVISGQKVIHMGARPIFVPKLVADLFLWAKKSKLNPLIKSCVVHFEIEYIHPFADGNGRIGRLWQSLILYKYNNFFEYLPIETLIYENQNRYYNSLSKAEKENSSTVFIEFMLEMILKTIEYFMFVYLQGEFHFIYFDHLSNTQQDILMKLLIYFENNEFINSNQAFTVLNKNKTNIRKFFAIFVKLNILIPTGKNKGRKYSLNKELFGK